MLLVLAIALPMQGMAAAMMSCSAGRHDHGSAQVQAHQGHDHAGTHLTTAEGKGEPGKATGHKCSACAACCAGAVAPSPSIVFESVKLTDHFAPLVARSIPAFVTEGLERPPRAASA